MHPTHVSGTKIHHLKKWVYTAPVRTIRCLLHHTAVRVSGPNQVGICADICNTSSVQTGPPGIIILGIHHSHFQPEHCFQTPCSRLAPTGCEPFELTLGMKLADGRERQAPDYTPYFLLVDVGAFLESGFLVGPAGGFLYFQVQFGGLRPAWDQGVKPEQGV